MSLKELIGVGLVIFVIVCVSIGIHFLDKGEAE